MTFVFELRGLIYGLLTVTAISSITALTQRLVKFLLPAPRNLQSRVPHLDSRDPLSALIVSWEVIPSVLKGKYAHRSLSGKCEPPPQNRQFGVIGLFFLAALLTIVSETTLILSTGAEGTALLVPDVVSSTFLGRHLIEPNTSLIPVYGRKLSSKGCLTKKVSVFREERYASYWQSLCVRSRVREPRKMLRNWTLSTEENLIDSLSLWVGWIEYTHVGDGRPRRDMHEYGSVKARINRRIKYRLDTSIKRVLDNHTGLLIANKVRDNTFCSLNNGGDPVLDRDLLDRPARIANFTCNSEMSVTEIILVLEKSILAAFGELPYSRKTPIFRHPADKVIMSDEMKLEVGVQVGESYEMKWFVGLSVVTSLGVVVWVLDFRRSHSIYPNVGLLYLMFKLSSRGGIYGNPLCDQPIVLRAQTRANTEARQSRIYYGYIRQEDQELL